MPSASSPDQLLQEIQRRLRNNPEMVEVSRAEAPVQQVVLTGDDADLTTLPVHLQHGTDGAPYHLRRRSTSWSIRTPALDQRRPAPADAARPQGNRHRPRVAERPARDL